MESDISKVKTDIQSLKAFWYQRNLKFKEWYETLTLIDLLAAKGLESYVSNEPQTFYNMAHYLLTRGELSHSIAINSESSIELDKRAKVDRGCQYAWKQIDRERKLGGSMPFLDELGHYLLVLGWYSGVLLFDEKTGMLKAQLWNPYDVYPRYANERLVACVHSYKITREEARIKAESNGWDYEHPGIFSPTAEVVLDDYWRLEGNTLFNMILIDGKQVTGWVDRPEMKLLVAPVAGFPDKGSLTKKTGDWRKLSGRSIFEVNESVSYAYNKWRTMISQILRDTAQSIMEEFSQTPQATVEQLRERAPLFHYAPGEEGLKRLPPHTIPIEIQAHLIDISKEMQKGSFNDAVFGMMEGQKSGYALSQLASSSANQILYPYMEAKHFFIEEGDNFNLSNLKKSGKVFNIKGKFIEQLKPEEIPEEVNVTVESEVATPKDMLEKGTIAYYLRDHLDKATLIHDVIGKKDPQAILRAKRVDTILDSPESLAIEKITIYRNHARYLRDRGDPRQADLFDNVANAMEAQIGAPAPGQGRPLEAEGIAAQREAGGAVGNTRRVLGARSRTVPPEATTGFSPQELRNMIGRGRLIRG